MYEMILHIAKRENVVSLKQIEKEIGLSKYEILRALSILRTRGKILYLNLNETHLSSCNNCLLKTRYKRGE
jgi:hypothetical protein